MGPRRLAVYVPGGQFYRDMLSLKINKLRRVCERVSNALNPAQVIVYVCDDEVEHKRNIDFAGERA